MLKTDYPLIIDSTTVNIKCLRFQINHGNITTENTTEAGTTDIEILRFGKVTINCQYRCMDEWTSFFVQCSKKPILTVKYYDPDTKAYAEKSMHMDAITTGLLKKSEDLAVTNGIYDVSFTLVEF